MDARVDHSSESDEETSTRHDRFKSERFQDSSQTDRPRPTQRGESASSRFANDDKYRSRSYRDRSPTRSYKYKESSSSSSRDRIESKHSYSYSHDRNERRHHSKSSKHEKAHQDYDKSSIEPKRPEKTTKTNLSSLLKDFDRKVESKRSDNDNKLDIGPALPPNFRKKLESKKDEDNFSSECSSVEPTLPPHLRQISGTSSKDEDSDSASAAESSDGSTSKVDDDNPQNGNTGSLSNKSLNLEGPALPPSLSENGSGRPKEEKTLESEGPVSSTQKQKEAEQTSLADSEQDSFGPALPPKVEASTYGPALPPKVEADSYGPALPPRLNNPVICGPTLPKEGIPENTGEDSEEDDDMVGPLPEGKMSMTQYQLNLRAMDIKRQLEEEKSGGSKDEKKREEWMLELPPEKAANLGLGPRQFRKRDAPDMSRRSEWTDTPADKLRKEQLAAAGVQEPTVSKEEMMQAAFIQERNEAMDKITKHSKEEDRPKSLLEMHQKKLKKKKKKEDKAEKEGKKKERRPFDRNVDLQANRFDDAQKKAIYKKARLLDTRFSSGASKYL